MQLKHKLNTILKRLKFKPRDFTFNCAIPNELGILVALPRSPGRLSLVINTVASLIQYFEGYKVIVGPESARELVTLFFGEQADYLSNFEVNEEKFKGDKEIGVIWDLSRPPSPYKDLPLFLPSADYRISADPETYPYYNIIVATGPVYDDITFSEKQLSLLNIPIIKFRPSIRDLAKRTVWDYLIFKGHGQRNILVFIDVSKDEELDIILDVLTKTLPTGVTIIAPRKIEKINAIDLSPMGSEGIVAALALTDLFIGGDSLYLGVADLMKMPTILIDTDITLPAVPHVHVWTKDMGVGALAEIITKSV
ncbi:MAG: hypothetical protein DRQ10_04110 [Candidatus Hydrothermota bacterium]|nr:MAG: hypothetical protein DRQ10_04110 [Candidatus Hydrothermae bacterium]